MKNKFRLLTVLAFAIIATFACKKEGEEDDLASTTEKTATFKGKVLANTDQTNDTTEFGTPQTQYEAPPAGTKIILSIDGYDLDATPDDDYDYPVRTFSTSTDASGNFSIELPALSNSTYEYVLDEFTANVKIGFQNNSPIFDNDVIFSATPGSVTLTQGQVRVKELFY